MAQVLNNKKTFVFQKIGCAANRKKNRRTLSSGADYLHHAAALRQHQHALSKLPATTAATDEPMDVSTQSLMLDLNVSQHMELPIFYWHRKQPCIFELSSE